MEYIFDPTYWNGTIFKLHKLGMIGQFTDYWRENKPIPAECLPKSLTIVDGNHALPDIFHTNRDIIVFSARARALMEERAPGQVAFIPVAITANPDIARQLRLARAYYFIQVLGRAQRFQWLEMPVDTWPMREDGVPRFGLLNNYRQWKLRPRLQGEPLIWREALWRYGNKEYRGHGHVFLEDSLWQELDETFPGQLDPKLVGTSIIQRPAGF